MTDLTLSLSYQRKDCLETEDFLDSLDVSAMKLGLDRMHAILQTLGNPQDRLPMIHIAGTNGKGSVSAMLSAILKAAGYQVGTFTSPHLIQVRERIALNGSPILPDDFHYEVQALKHHLEALKWPREDWPTYFEFLNVVAYQYFLRKGVEMAVFETGLGGRLDSTNVVAQPNLTVITGIGMDHMQHLGNTLAAIASEKAGIIKSQVPLVLNANTPPEAKQVILEKANQMAAAVTLSQVENNEILPSSTAETGLQIQDKISGTVYHLSLLAPYQVQNFAVVMACIQQLRQQNFKISETALQQGFSTTYWPVRFQYFPVQRFILDGSHNEDGFKALHQALDFYFQDQPKTWLLSLRKNRNPELLTKLLAQSGPIHGITLTQAQPEHLYHSPEALAELLRCVLDARCVLVIETDPLQAYQRLKQMQGDSESLAVATGSLYTAGAILAGLDDV